MKLEEEAGNAMGGNDRPESIVAKGWKEGRRNEEGGHFEGNVNPVNVGCTFT